MKSTIARTTLSLSIAFAFVSAACADDAVPNLENKNKAPAIAARGTTPDYLTNYPSKDAKPVATPAASPGKPVPIAVAPEAITKPKVKGTVRSAKKSAPRAITQGVDIRFAGDAWSALQLLALKFPELNVSRTGEPFGVPVTLELQHASETDAVAALGGQTGQAADIRYSQSSHTAELAYRNGRSTQPAAIPVVPPAVSALEETKNWQAGGSTRPVNGPDGLLTFPFGQSQPTLTCQPLRACDIQLQAGEIINNVILGDTVRWIPAPATTGTGAQAIPHVIVKPTEANLQTNLIITTNRRTYMLTLKSNEGQYVSRVGFYYPQDMVQDWNGQAETEKRKTDADASRKVSDMPITSIDQLNLDSYTVSGDKSLPWYPVRVFDEGTHVWIQMPASIKSSEAPALVLIGKDGKSELVNYRVKQASQGGTEVTYYIVDKLFSKAALIIGVGGDQQKIEIKKASERSVFNLFGA